MTLMSSIRRAGALCLRTLVTGAAVLSAMPATAQTVTYIHTDALGSVVAESDADGNVVKRYDYEPYGALVGGELADGPGYTGHVSDATTGLNYMQQRYMDSQLGVFLSVDPVTAYQQPLQQFNRYRYANGNPYRFTDPDGRSAAALAPLVIIPIVVGVTYYATTTPEQRQEAGRAIDQGIKKLLRGDNSPSHIQRADTAESAAEKIKAGASPSTGSKSGNGDIHPGGEEAADAVWGSIEGVGETSRYQDRHGNITEVKNLDGGGIVDRHVSTKSDHKGAPSIKVRDAEKKVIQTTRYEKNP